MSIQQGLNRREFMRVAGGAAALSVSICSCNGKATKAAGTSANRPNIVFIIADDLGWRDVGYNGSEINTPNIDRLAEQAVRFEKHYVMPTCTPTRIGLMTGRYPSRYGVTSPDYGKLFDDDTVTLALALRNSGYETSITGKWHMGSPPECTPLKYGFNSSYGYFHGQIDPYTHHYKTGVRSWHRNDQYLDEQGHATDLITDEAIRIIQLKRSKPFFLYVAYSVPHFPLAEPDEWTSPYKEKIREPSRRWFAASVTHMDDGIGRIVDSLKRTGQRENTLLVFVSDNGGQQSWHDEEQYKGRYADKPHTVLGDNRPLRGWKGQVYEGGIRVPAMAEWPGTLKAGKVSSPVHIVDWMPTLCKLAGYSAERDLRWDGRDIWPLICGRTAHGQARTLYWKTPRTFGLRHGDWKLIVNGDGGRAELYNIAADPYEKREVSKEHPQRVRELKSLLAQHTRDDK